MVMTKIDGEWRVPMIRKWKWQSKMRPWMKMGPTAKEVMVIWLMVTSMVFKQANARAVTPKLEELEVIGETIEPSEAGKVKVEVKVTGLNAGDVVEAFVVNGQVFNGTVDAQGMVSSEWTFGKETQFGTYRVRVGSITSTRLFTLHFYIKKCPGDQCKEVCIVTKDGEKCEKPKWASVVLAVFAFALTFAGLVAFVKRNELWWKTKWGRGKVMNVDDIDFSSTSASIVGEQCSNRLFETLAANPHRIVSVAHPALIYTMGSYAVHASGMPVSDEEVGDMFECGHLNGVLIFVMPGTERDVRRWINTFVDWVVDMERSRLLTLQNLTISPKIGGQVMDFKLLHSNGAVKEVRIVQLEMENESNFASFSWSFYQAMVDTRGKAWYVRVMVGYQMLDALLLLQVVEMVHGLHGMINVTSAFENIIRQCPSTIGDNKMVARAVENATSALPRLAAWHRAASLRDLTMDAVVIRYMQPDPADWQLAVENEPGEQEDDEGPEPDIDIDPIPAPKAMARAMFDVNQIE